MLQSSYKRGLRRRRHVGPPMRFLSADLAPEQYGSSDRREGPHEHTREQREGTGHARDVYGLGYGLRLTANTEVTADFRRQEGGETGNPPFPMDIRYMDTSTSRLGLTTQVEAWSLSVRAEHARVDHAMNNFDQRKNKG